MFAYAKHDRKTLAAMTAIRVLFCVSALCVFAALPAHAAGGRTDTVSPAYPYSKSGVFASFVVESFRVSGAKNPDADARLFFHYMGSAIPVSMDDAKKSAVTTTTTIQARAAAERAVCAALHKAIKKQIPRFSLDRGFEFTNTAKRGERQCYLQSVVIAALLQRAGIPAGVAMVSRNENGDYCNNGHVVAVARLSDNTDLVVDASEKTPFIAHQGLMVVVPATGGYSYVAPVYDKTHRITAYRSLRTGKTLPPSDVALLDVPFLRSQFTYYRGERTPGGLFTAPLVTATGLARSEQRLAQSVRECPRNPLAVYMLGRVQERRGNPVAAQKSYNNAYGLYLRYGWIPDEMNRARTAVKQRKAGGGRMASAP